MLAGMLKIYSSFSTFDALSMHIRMTKGVKSIDWFTYVRRENESDDNSADANNSDGLAINYRGGVVSCVYKHQHFTSLESNEWIRLLKMSSPFVGCVDSEKMFRLTEYLQMFECIQQKDYNINDLQNRQFINGPAIISRFIDFDFNKRLNQKNGSHVRIANAFERGALYSALRKTSSENEEWYKNYPQNYDNTLHDGRSDKVGYLLPTVTRASNSAIRNSNALEFPPDAVNYFCMLNTKDLRSAGEQNVMADFVMMCERSDPILLYNYLARRNQQTGNILVIDGYIVPFRIVWSLKELVAVKREFGHITTKCYDPYVLFSTRPCIPIKYHQEHDVFFSPAETTYYRLVYPEADILSTSAKLLGVRGLRKTLPAKATVSLNNVKGCVANVTSEFHKIAMENNLGITCYIDQSERDRKRMPELAVISTGHSTEIFDRMYERLKSLNCFEEGTPISETDRGKAMLALSRLYPMDHLLIECTTHTAPPFKIARNPNSAPLAIEYLSTIFSKDLYDPPSIWNLRLYACFGNPYGSCIEDGVVMDENTVAQLPPITYNACITVEFSFSTKKKPKLAYFIHVNGDETRNITDTNHQEETLIGCIVSPHEAHVKNSKHTVINMRKIGDHYYYLIHFLPKLTNMYQNLTVSHIYDSKSLSVVIKGQSRVAIGVGSKVANKYGQKNVCSKVVDMSNCWGITRSGKKVHAQIVYSEISLLGRLPAGQLHEMLTSPDLALGPNGEIIAPIDLVVHTLHPYTNNKVFNIKVDTMTNVNGFMSQNLNNASFALRSSSVLDKVVQVLSMLGMKIDFMNVVELPMPYSMDVPETSVDESAVVELDDEWTTVENPITEDQEDERMDVDDIGSDNGDDEDDENDDV